MIHFLKMNKIMESVVVMVRIQSSAVNPNLLATGTFFSPIDFPTRIPEAIEAPI